MVTIWTGAWSIVSVLYTTRYQESQVLLAVTLWLSGIVVNRTFTLGGVDVHTCLFVNHHHAFVRVLNFLDSENFAIYGSLHTLIDSYKSIYYSIIRTAVTCLGLSTMGWCKCGGVSKHQDMDEHALLAFCSNRTARQDIE